MVNEAAIRALIAHLEINIDRWDQHVFYSRRGDTTAHCMAAWTVILAGRDLLAMLRQPGGDMRVYRHAQLLLGLDFDQAHSLFEYFDNGRGEHPSLDDLKARVTAVTGVTFKPVLHR